jgi:diacylglycerol O-acyltransferase
MPEAPVAAPMGQLDRVVDAIRHERRRQAGVARRGWGSVTSAAVSAVADAIGTATRATETLASVGRLLAPATQPLSDVMTGRSLSVRFDVVRIPLTDLKAAANGAGGKLNDAFVGGVAGGLRRYHLRHGSSVGELRMTMPINIRNDATADLAGNQFAPARFAVPLTIDDPVERMARMRELVATQRGEPALALAEPLAAILYRLPATVSTGVFGAMLRGVDFVTSNVPGVPIPVFLAGARMEAQFAFGPMSGAATNITLLSYLDDVLIGINSDPAAIPDPEVLLGCIEEGFAEVVKSV